MKIRYSQPLAGQSGTTKDSRYNYFTRGGRNFARRRAKVPDRTTAQQSAIRAVIREVSRSWQTLTAEQRKSWLEYIRQHNGEENPNRTAIDQYMLCNINRSILGLPLLGDAPEGGAPPEPIEIRIMPAGADDEIRFTITHPIVASQVGRFVVLLKQTPPTATPGRAPKPNDAVLIKGVSAESSAPLGPSGGDAVYEFTGIRHPVAAGQRFGLSVQIVERGSGLASTRRFKDSGRVGLDSEI